MTSGGRRTTTIGHSRPVEHVPADPVPPLDLPEGDWSPLSVEFWRSLTAQPARRSWTPQHLAVAKATLHAFEKSLTATSPNWSTEMRRLLALLPGGLREQDTPIITETPEPVMARPVKKRPDPRLRHIPA